MGRTACLTVKQGQRLQHVPTPVGYMTSEYAARSQLSDVAGAGYLSNRAEVVLGIDSEEQLPAAESVIAALYGVDDCFDDLPHDQLVHALVIADMIDLPRVAQQIMAILQAASSSAAGLSEAAQASMADLSAWPACLYQLLPSLLAQFIRQKQLTEFVGQVQDVVDADSNSLMQSIMLAAFGDLQAVWQNPELSDVLLGLPLPAMQLLLSSDELQVPSEDIVLYTAQRYLETQPHSTADNIKAALAGLVRAPYLSDFALQHAAFSNAQSSRVQLSAPQDQLRKLMSLKRIERGPLESALMDFKEAPESWKKGRRQSVLEQPAILVWELPVRQLAAACKKAAEQRSTEWMHGPESPPFAGVSWKMHIKCKGEEEVTTVGLFTGPCNTAPGLYVKFQFSISCNDRPARASTSDCIDSTRYWGWADFFEVGSMSGGWDAAAWAGKGLPTRGNVVCEFRMLKVW